jgi:hypothetical protein
MNTITGFDGVNPGLVENIGESGGQKKNEKNYFDKTQ